MSKFSVISKFLVLSAVYLLGRYNFPIGYVLPFFSSVFFDAMKPRCVIARSAEQEEEMIMSRLGNEVPSWVLFPDVERAEWLNTIMSLLWPNINKMVGKLLRDIEDKLKENEMLKSFSLKTVDLGRSVSILFEVSKHVSSFISPSDKAPRITGIKVHKANVLRNEIVLDVSVNYIGDCNLSFSFFNSEGGLKDFQFKGNLRLIISHLDSLNPLMCNIEAYFLDCPDFDYQLFKILSAFDMFEVGDALRTFIKSELNSRVVFPNRFFLKLKDQTDDEQMSMVDGVVRVQVGMTGFKAWIEDKKVLVKFDLGTEQIDEEILVNDADSEIIFQRDLVKLKSSDNVLRMSLSIDNGDGLISYLEQAVDVTNLSAIEVIDEKFTFSNFESASVTLTWINLSENPADFQVTPSENVALLEVFIDSVRTFESFATPVCVKLSTYGSTKMTRACDAKLPCKQNFTFLLKQLDSEELSVIVCEQLSGNKIGQFNYKLSQLMSRPGMSHDLQAFPLSQSYNYCEVVMSAKLSALQAP